MFMTGLVRRNSTAPSLLDRDEFLTPFATLFNDIFNDSFDFLGKDFFDKSTYPKVDVLHDEERIVIEAEIPGLKRDQISVEVEGEWLRIKGEKRSKDENKNQTYIHRELKHSAFCRSFKLPQTVDKEKFTAEFENGVLYVILPKKVIEPPPSQVKKIEIK